MKTVKMRYNFLIFLVLISVLNSCDSFRSYSKNESELNYLQNFEKITEEISIKSGKNTLQIGDQLQINVMAKDLDVVRPFNQNYSSGLVLSNPQPSGNANAMQTLPSGPTYIINGNGEIDFPVLGKLNTTGKTLDEFQNELRDKLSRYIINPSVSVRLLNYKVTILGDVARPGEYTIADGKVTLLSALGLAGDLTMYGKRDNVLVVRNTDGNISKERINLLDASFINSPYYHLKQGDVVYVSSNKTRERSSRLDPNMPIYISVASIVVTILALVIRR